MVKRSHEPDICERLDRWRRARGVSIADLAAAAGISSTAVHYWFTPNKEKRTRPSQEHLEKAVARLGLTMSGFYGTLPEERAA